MTIAWLDVLKLTVPFVTAILMVWIKATIERGLLRRNKQHALSRLISDEVRNLAQAVEALRKVAQSGARGKLQLVSLDISALMPKLGSDLSDLDAKHAYGYSDFVSSIAIVDKGIGRLSSFIESRAACDHDTTSTRLDRAIVAQAEILARDLVSFGESSLNLVQVLPPKHRYQDAQEVKALQDSLASARVGLMDWPMVRESEPEQSQPAAV